jgi:hypothetical protein
MHQLISKSYIFISKGGIFLLPIIAASGTGAFFFFYSFFRLLPWVWNRKYIHDDKLINELSIAESKNFRLSKFLYNNSGPESFAPDQSFLIKISGPVIKNSQQDPAFIFYYSYSEFIRNKLFGISVPSIIAQIVCLMGFMGTVSGMIKVFDTVAVSGTVIPSQLAEGISEAMITTLFGLVVAVPSWISHHILKTMADIFLYKSEKRYQNYINLLDEKGFFGRVL